MHQKLFFVFIITVSIVIFSYLVINKTAKWFFFAKTDTSSADIIFTFGGEQARENHAMRLMDKFVNAQWIVSSPRPLTQAKIDSGGWKGRITVIDGCKNTLDEVNFIADLSNQNKDKDIVLLSGPYHLRRIERFIRGKGSDRIHFVAVPMIDYNTTNWHLFKLFVFEMQKMIYYSFLTRFNGI
jgi:uncharacterized SAM-binding protein YcdF (DUF218 family)